MKLHVQAGMILDNLFQIGSALKMGKGLLSFNVLHQMNVKKKILQVPSLMTAGFNTYPHPPFSRNFPVFRFIIMPGVW